jgi:L-threonylcarbamoyladenylate synthase
MRVLKVSKQNILIASNIIKSGGLVVFPTETVYGLGCNPLDLKAVRKIINVKGDRKKPLPVLVSNLGDAKKIAFITAKGEILANKFWPGPLSIVFHKKNIISNIVTFGLDSIALRIPNNNDTIELISQCGGLLIGSSANITGEEPPRNINEISKKIFDNVNIVLDGGTIIGGKPSTIVDLTSDKPRIIRNGPISFEKIMVTLGLEN